MGCGSSSSATGTAPEGTAAEAPANGNNHKSSGISGRGHGPHAPKAKQMSRAHFESKIGTVGFDKADVSKPSDPLTSTLLALGVTPSQ